MEATELIALRKGRTFGSKKRSLFDGLSNNLVFKSLAGLVAMIVSALYATLVLQSLPTVGF